MKINIFKGFLFIIVSAVILFQNISCKKEKDVSKSIDSATLEFKLDNTNPTHFSILLLEGTQTIDNFDETLTIGDSVVDAAVTDNKNIVFIIPPNIQIGQQSVTLKCNGKSFVFSINVKPLPTVSDPKKLVSDFIANSKYASDKISAAMDSLYSRTGTTPDPVAIQLKFSGKKIQDSLTKMNENLNYLSPAELQIAGNIISANMVELNQSWVLTNEIADMFIGNKLTRRGRLLNCNDNTSNYSQKIHCIMLNCTKSIALTMVKLIKKAMHAGLAGAAVGLLVSALSKKPQAGPLAWKAGLSAAFTVLAWQNAAAIKDHLEVVFMCLVNVFVVTDQEIGVKLEPPTNYKNGQKQSLEYLLTLRNMQSEDLTSSTGFISDFLKEYFNFSKLVKENMSDYFPVVPGFQKLITQESRVEDINYLNVKVLNNPKVTTEGFTGDKDNLQLAFNSSDIADQSFEYSINYDDGVLKNTTTFQATLKTDISLTLTDTTVPADSKNIYFDVTAPDFMSWSISYPTNWMIVSPPNGNGNKRIEINIQNNYTGSDRSDFVKFKCGTTEIWKKITQTSATKPKISIIRNSLNVSASGTGGTPPYTFEFPTYSFTSIGSNSGTLKRDGYYYVVLKDSKGFTDTAVDSIFLITITNVTLTTQNDLEITFENPFHIYPEFLIGNSLLNNNGLFWYVTSSNNIYIKKDGDDPCTIPTSFQSPSFQTSVNGATYKVKGHLMTSGTLNYNLSFRLRTWKVTEAYYCPSNKPRAMMYSKTLYTFDYN